MSKHCGEEVMEHLWSLRLSNGFILATTPSLLPGTVAPKVWSALWGFMWLEWMVVLALFPYSLSGTETVNVRVQLFFDPQGLVSPCSGTSTNLLLWNPKRQCAIVVCPPQI